MIDWQFASSLGVPVSYGVDIEPMEWTLDDGSIVHAQHVLFLPLQINENCILLVKPEKHGVKVPHHTVHY